MGVRIVNLPITKEKFAAYMKVQYGGRTNMFDIKRVMALSGGRLTKGDCEDIMENYETYFSKWSEEIEKSLARR